MDARRIVPTARLSSRCARIRIRANACARCPRLSAMSPKAGQRRDRPIGGRTLALSNQNKELWPGEYTKGDLVRYYQAVAPFMLPYLHERPLTLERYPNGINEPSFFEKEVPAGAPEWVRTGRPCPRTRRGATRINFVVCDDEATLVWLANLAAIVLHMWMSRAPSLEPAGLRAVRSRPVRRVHDRHAGPGGAWLPRRARRHRLAPAGEDDRRQGAARGHPAGRSLPLR